jgi:Fic family protein/cell division protein FtsB
MDESRFTRNAPGKLVSVSIGTRDCAFVPRSLPRKWNVPNELWPLLASAREELSRLDGIGRTLPSADLLLSPLQRREALRSSSLEGTYASAEELLLFELQPIEAASVNERSNDWREVFNYAKALNIGTSLLNELPLSLRVIRSMHQQLLTGVRGRDRAPGEFRRNQVHIGTDRRYVPPPPHELDRCLDDFERFLNAAESIDPLVRCYLAHYQFEAIHPFIDGNGRVGRALLSLCAFKWSRLSWPWLYMSPFFEQNKDEYIDRLFAVSTNGEWQEWLSFCLRGTVEVCRDAVTRCDRLRLLRETYHSRVSRVNKRMHSIIDRLFVNPVVRVIDLARLLEVTYPTARTDIDRPRDRARCVLRRRTLTVSSPRRTLNPMPASVSTHDSRRVTQTAMRVVVLISGALAVLFCIFLFSDRGSAGELQQARQRVDVLKADVKRLEADNARLRAEVQSAKKSTYAVERIAREELGMSKKGEVIYMLPRSPMPSAVEASRTAPAESTPR